MIPHTRQQVTVIWGLWFSLFTAVFFYQFALGGGVPLGPNAQPQGMDPIFILAAVQLAAALGIRWILIPRANAAGKLLVLMIVGLSLSEAVELNGLFLVPEGQARTRFTLWILSIVSTLQFVPLYALPRQDENPFQGG